MWPDSEDLGRNECPGRASTSSEVVIVDEQALAASQTPTVSKLNVTNSSRVHIGPKFVSVTQNVHNSEVIKDLKFPRYLYTVIKNTTRAERLSCIVAVLLIVVCTILITYFTVMAKNQSETDDVAPHEWNITRKMWLAQDYNNTDTTTLYEPLRLVIIQHSVSSTCQKFVICAAELRNMQKWFLMDYKYDIPYNFLIGNDGRVYEGRGWNKVGAHTKGYNLCSVGIGFIGDYREEKEGHTKVTEAQLNRTEMLLNEGVRRGYLHPLYVVVGAKDLKPSESPGSNLHAAIKKWKHYDHKNRYKGMNCDQINSKPISSDK